MVNRNVISFISIEKTPSPTPLQSLLFFLINWSIISNNIVAQIDINMKYDGMSLFQNCIQSYMYDSLHVVFRPVFMQQENRLFSMDHFIMGGLPTWKTPSCQQWQTFSCITNPYSHGKWKTWLINWEQLIFLLCQEQAPRFKCYRR